MKITRSFSVLALTLIALISSLLSGCTTAPAATVSELAPGGTLRAAINLGNPILATRDPATGQARGVSVDLSRELAQRLGVKLELITFTSAGQVVDAVKDAKPWAWAVPTTSSSNAKSRPPPWFARPPPRL